MEKIGIQDIVSYQFLSAPALSPDGAKLAYLLTRSDWKENGYQTDLHVLDTATGENFVPVGAGKDGDFLWEDAHTLLVRAAYEEADECKPYAPFASFYRVDARSGEKTKAFEIPGDVLTVKKVSAGLYAATVFVDRNAPDPAVTPEDECKEYLDYHIVEEAPLWENGVGYVSGKRAVLHLFREADGSLTPVTNETTEVRDFRVGGTKLAIIGRDWHDTLQDRLSGLSLYDIESGETTVVVPQETAKVGRADFVDGGKLLYTLSDNKLYGDGQLGDFYLYDIVSGESRMLCGHDDLAVGGGVLSDMVYGKGTVWKAVGGKVYFAALHGFERALYSVDVTGTVQKEAAIPGGSVEFFDADASGVYLAGTAEDDGMNLYRADAAGLQKLTDVNAEALRGKFISYPEYTPFFNREETRIDGWVLKPYGYDETKKYPAVLEIHGGPRAAYGTGFVHEMQALASAGYFVFFCNPRGSEGRGEAFADIRGRHGTVDYDDLMEFTDYILARYPQIDETRVAAAGGSYAGFMCNWIEGHTDRFAAIVSQRSVSDFVADYCISDLGFTYDREATLGNPWDDTEKLWFHSPYKYAPFAKTPILFLHSLEDYDCTIDQGVMMFQAMKYFGVPTRMCLFEGENHELSRSGKPRHRVRRLRELTNWIGKYLA